MFARLPCASYAMWIDTDISFFLVSACAFAYAFSNHLSPICAAIIENRVQRWLQISIKMKEEKKHMLRRKKTCPENVMNVEKDFYISTDLKVCYDVFGC